jgi:Flp pilus assembly protein TadG
MVAVFMVALFAFAALSLDVGNVLREQRKVHTGTDAGALAGVMLLTNNPPPTLEAIQARATLLAAANGVTTNEIANGAFRGYPGEVQRGIWAGGTFIANVTSNGTYNAVRVPARRVVPLHFGRVVGLTQMTPAIASVAALDVAGTVANAIPFGISTNEFAGKTIGDTMILNDAGIGSGKQGKVYLQDYRNTGEWLAAMLSPNGCNCEVSVGPIPAQPGNAQVRQAFQAIGVGAQFLMPVVANFSFSGGSGIAEIVGFVLVEIVDFSGTGSNWSATVRFLREASGIRGGGRCPPGAPCEYARFLAE